MKSKPMNLTEVQIKEIHDCSNCRFSKQVAPYKVILECELWRVDNITLKATDTFVVEQSAIPEFSWHSALVVPLIVTGIFLKMRRRK